MERDVFFESVFFVVWFRVGSFYVELLLGNCFLFISGVSIFFFRYRLVNFCFFRLIVFIFKIF